MTSPRPDRFTRVPVDWLDALLRVPLTGTECRILLWVVRQTLGWNRATASFTWYRMAKDLGADRGGICRAGKKLVLAHRLTIADGRIGLALNQAFRAEASLTNEGPETARSVVDSPRGPGSSEIRRTIDNANDVSKIDKHLHLRRIDDPRHRSSLGPHPAGAAHPIRGKYDGVS